MNRIRAAKVVVFILAMGVVFSCFLVHAADNSASLYQIKKSVVWAAIITFFIILITARAIVSFHISRRRDAEIFLSDSERVLRATLNATDNGILVVDYDGHILEANDMYFNMWNIPRDVNGLDMESNNVEFIKKQVLDSGPFGGWMDSVSRTTAAGHYIVNLTDERVVYILYTPLMNEEDMVGRVWSFRDISERKKNEKLKSISDENVRLVRETLEYDKIKTEFFANISHELKTPLNIIIGVLKLFELGLGDKNAGLDKAKLMSHARIMKKNCDRLLKMLGNLIYITEIDSGFTEMHMRNNDLVQIVRSIALAARGFMEDKGVQFDLNICSDSIIIACDGDKIERALLNLLSNAVKFTESDSRISVSVSSKEDFAYISVKDNGIGITDEMKEIIFQRFRQVDKSFTRRCEGSGIGLPIAKALIEMHNGSIEVNSDFGKGSEFIVKLPIWQLDSGEIAATSEQEAGSCIDRINIEFSDIY